MMSGAKWNFTRVVPNLSQPAKLPVLHISGDVFAKGIVPYDTPHFRRKFHQNTVRWPRNTANSRINADHRHDEL